MIDESKDYSFLGDMPTCNHCGQLVKVGHEVQQIIIGKVELDTTQGLVIPCDSIVLVHTVCPLSLVN